MWTFGRKIAVGFAISFVLLLGIGTVAYRGIDTLTKTSYAVAHTHVVLEHIAGVVSQLEDAETGQRGFVLTGDDAYLDPYRSAVDSLGKLVKDLRDLTVDNPSQQKRIDAAEPLIQAKLAELKRTIDLRRQGGLEPALKLVQTGEGKKAMDDLRAVADQMEREERDLLKRRADEVEMASGNARITIIFGTLFCLLFVTAAGFFLTRSLTNQIGSAVRHVQSSSTELQSAANQQATGAKETSTSMTEITTTISELLATSRQIAESAQRVASIAGQTTEAARSGEGTVLIANDSIASIRQQVDLVVNHTLELGRKSQQIGSVLDIVAELAEQTNILAINATIEAAGAGESGKRFSVVADEIRKLADRVAGSTKEIRTLIDDVRGAVNTTVMATETGSKAVDAGSKQFGDVAAAFKAIAGLVVTTTQAAREIELSTKQQTTAVEQVNMAIANTAQATKETEVSLGQTLQTASQLAGLSKDLLRLVQPQGAA
jgi:methyl-accepting chemotaxis protein